MYYSYSSITFHYIRVMHLKNIPLKAAVLLALLPKILYILGSILIPAHVHMITFSIRSLRCIDMTILS